MNGNVLSSIAYIASSDSVQSTCIKRTLCVWPCDSTEIQAVMLLLKQVCGWFKHSAALPLSHSLIDQTFLSGQTGIYTFLLFSWVM